MHTALEQRAADFHLSAPEHQPLRLTFAYGCVSRVRHLLEEEAVIACLDALGKYVDDGLANDAWAQAKAAIEALPMKPLLTKVVSAHVMGGCGMAGSANLGVTRPDGRHWQIDNLSVHDGSLFPTSIGANPQLSIYGIVNRLAQNLVRHLGARSVTLA